MNTRTWHRAKSALAVRSHTLMALAVAALIVFWVVLFVIARSNARQRATSQTIFATTAAQEGAVAVASSGPTDTERANRGPSPSVPAPTIDQVPKPSPVSAKTTPDDIRATVTTAEEPATMVDGQLIVASEPAGARVTVDGVGWGTTPVTIRHLPFGVKRIRATLDGYDTAQRTVSLSADTPERKVQLTLRNRP